MNRIIEALRRHLFLIIFVAAAAVAAFFIVRSMTSRTQTPDLSVVILTNQTSAIDSDMLEQEFRETTGLTSESDTVTVTVYTPEDPGTQKIVLGRMREHTVDLLIAEREAFMSYADKKCFGSLKDLLPTDWPDGHYTWVPDSYPAYGLRLKDTTKLGLPFRDRGSAIRQTYTAGIALSSEHKENAARAMLFLL